MDNLFKCNIDVTGVIINKLEVKITKNDTKWICLKVKTCNSNCMPFIVKVKVFDDIADIIFNKYSQGDIINVIGECHLSKYYSKDKLYVDLDIYPNEIKLISKMLNKNVVLK